MNGITSAVTAACMAAAPTCLAYGLTAHLEAAGIADPETSTPGPIRVAENAIERSSYAGQPSWQPEFQGSSTRTWTARPADHAIIVGSWLAEDTLAFAIADLRHLENGWDGRDAARPAPAAISEATIFARLAGKYASRLEPTVHADGSVLLEIEDGSEGSFRFRGDGTVVYAINAVGVGVVALNRRQDVAAVVRKTFSI